ncbi:MAG: M23 family metallopeptidase [Nitrospirota bacterium]|nr:M23 family metallopeptidase [Nitrospirota bacterium]
MVTRFLKARKDRIAIIMAVLLTSIFPVDLLTSAPPEPHGMDGQFSGKQGEIIVVRVPVDQQTTAMTGRFLNRQIPFFPEASGAAAPSYIGLVGVDLQDTPGTHELVLDVVSPAGRRRLSYNLLVMKEKRAIQHLTLPKDKVDLDEDSLIRVKAEQAQVRTVLEAVSERRLWASDFLRPVDGPVTGAFGRQRIINGQAKSPHNGEDIAAPLGADVVAMNDGVVCLTADHFFSGKGVFVDHGLGLYSMYFHLSEVSVKDGEAVKRGQVIGKVGASGRATGPHLHWGVNMNGARVDPLSLIKLSFNRPLLTVQ